MHKIDTSIFNLSAREFDRALETLKKQYYNEVRANESLRNKLREYNQADEIAKRDAEIDRLWDRSLLVMSEKEAAANKAFIHKHYELHKPKRTSKYIYTLTGPGVGTAITIKCPICDAEEDITDVESW